MLILEKASTSRLILSLTKACSAPDRLLELSKPRSLRLAAHDCYPNRVQKNNGTDHHPFRHVQICRACIQVWSETRAKPRSLADFLSD